MSEILYSIGLQWKLDLRNKGMVITYYIVPLIFFAFMGKIFTSIDPMIYKTLIPAMTVFSVTMGAIIGSPSSLVETFRSDIKNAYKVGGIPLWTVVFNNFISGFIHLFITSLIIFFVAPIIFDATVPSNIIVYFINLALFIISCLSIGTVLGLVVKSSAKLTMISQFIFLPSVMLSGIMFPINLLPDFLKKLGMIFPSTWGFENMSKNKFDISTIVPLVVIFIICLLISLWQIKKLKTD